MTSMCITIGNDHAGTDLKFKVKSLLEELGYKVDNYGTNTTESVDYPDYVHPVVNNVKNGKSDVGILICGSAQGVSMTANKYNGIRAAVCWDSEISLLARKHNDANVLCLPARFISEKEANQIVLVFLQTAFEGGRHLTRIKKIDTMVS